MGQHQPANTNDVLEGWKEIATVLGVSVSTAKRLGRGKPGLAKIPTFRSLTGHRAIRLRDLERWHAAEVLRLPANEIAPPLPTRRPAA
jgi:hypothetical protein